MFEPIQARLASFVLKENGIKATRPNTTTTWRVATRPFSVTSCGALTVNGRSGDRYRYQIIGQACRSSTLALAWAIRDRMSSIAGQEDDLVSYLGVTYHAYGLSRSRTCLVRA